MSKDWTLSSTNSDFLKDQIRIKGHGLKLYTGLCYKVSSYRCQLREAEIGPQGANQVKEARGDTSISSLDQKELEEDTFLSTFSAWLQLGWSYLLPIRVISTE